MMIPGIGEVGSTEFKVTLVALALAAAALAGGWVAGRIKDAEISQIEATAAKAEAETTRAALKRMNDAIARGDRLTERLSALQAQADQLLQEKNDAIKKVTTGRACLNGATVRVLNGSEPGLLAPTVPQAGGQPTSAGTGAADGADDQEEGASDTDVAQWIVTAQRFYTVCRSRLQALIDYYED